MTIAIDWGDGKPEDTVAEVTGSTHTYDDGGMYVIGVRRSDEPGTEAVAFNAIAPPPEPLTVTAQADAANGLKCTLTIEGGKEPYTIAWGDTGTKSFEDGGDLSHTYAAGGSFTITVIDAAATPAGGTTTFEAIAPPVGTPPILTSINPKSATVGT